MRSTRELADYLGLSRWTISRVLNGHDGIGSDTRQRVLAAVEELGFHPSTLARGLRGGPTGLVGICFQEMDSPIRARKAAVLQTLLRQNGMRGMMELNAHDPELERTIIRHFLDLRVDAIVLFGTYLAPEDDLMALLIRSSTPIIVVDPPRELPLPTISLDRGEAMRQGLRHLYDLGHRQFVLIGLAHDPVYGPMRLAGLKAAAEALDLDPGSAFVALNTPEDPSLDYAAGAQLANRLLAEAIPATAIIALNDCLAIGAISALRDAGRRVPEDFSVLGFDDIGVAPWIDPPLSTLSQETEKLCAAALEMLTTVLQSPKPANTPRLKESLRSTLVVRGSTGLAPASAPTGQSFPLNP